MSTDVKQAAVLLPILDTTAKSSTPYRLLDLNISESAEILFTIRTNTVEHHKGQISFPGGMFETGDADLKVTALRETEEELGIDRKLIQIVSELEDAVTLSTGFRIKPYIGLVDAQTIFQPSSDEIAEILRVPLTHLLNPRHSEIETYLVGGANVQVRAYHYQGHRIWGATARILQVFLEKHLKF